MTSSSPIPWPFFLISCSSKPPVYIAFNDLVANSLSFNALNFNALIGNAIVANSLTGNALTSNAIVANALTGLAIDPNENSLSVLDTMSLESIAGLTPTVPNNMTIWYVPELMKFFVGCALDSGQSWNMTYNGTSYTFEGSLGLAPSVLTTPLTTVQAGWISGCLMARVNYYQKHVIISLRGTALSTTPEEEEQYNVWEGAFFVNIFSVPQEKYVCQGIGEEEVMLLSPDGDLRVCTDPSFNCSFTNVGKCSSVCDTPSGPCYVNGTQFDQVIDVYLLGMSGGSMTNWSFVIVVALVVLWISQ